MGVKVVGEKCCLFLLSPEMPAASRDTITNAYRFTRGSNYDKNLPFVDMECLALAPVYTNASFHLHHYLSYHQTLAVLYAYPLAPLENDTQHRNLATILFHLRHIATEAICTCERNVEGPISTFTVSVGRLADALFTSPSGGSDDDDDDDDADQLDLIGRCGACCAQGVLDNLERVANSLFDKYRAHKAATSHHPLCVQQPNPALAVDCGWPHRWRTETANKELVVHEVKGLDLTVASSSESTYLFNSTQFLRQISPLSPLHVRAFGNRCLQWLYNHGQPFGTIATLLVIEEEEGAAKKLLLVTKANKVPQEIQDHILNGNGYSNRLIHVHGVPDSSDRLFDTRPMAGFAGFARMRSDTTIELLLYRFCLDEQATLLFVITPSARLHVAPRSAVTVAVVLSMKRLPPCNVSKRKEAPAFISVFLERLVSAPPGATWSAVQIQSQEADARFCGPLPPCHGYALDEYGRCVIHSS